MHSPELSFKQKCYLSTIKSSMFLTQKKKTKQKKNRVPSCFSGYFSLYFKIFLNIGAYYISVTDTAHILPATYDKRLQIDLAVQSALVQLRRSFN